LNFVYIGTKKKGSSEQGKYILLFMWLIKVMENIKGGIGGARES